MKFASFIIGEAKTLGKDEALASTVAYDEKFYIESFKELMFEDMGMEKIEVFEVNDPCEIEGVKGPKEGAMPGRPTTHFY